MRRIFAAAIAALLSAQPSFAIEGEASIRRFVAEGAGTITIEPDGTVSAATLPDELQPALREAYLRAIRTWTFEPIVIEGRAVRALGHMDLSFAIELKGEHFHRASIERVVFTDPPSEQEAPASTGSARMRPPAYPMALARQGIGGEVMLAIETDDHGRVRRVAPVAGQIYADVPTRDEGRARQAFGRLAAASLQAAKHWQLSGCRSAVCTVPVRYTIRAEPGRPPFWTLAHPVPVTPEPWVLQAGAVAMGANGVPPSQRIQLKSSVEGSDVLGIGG